MRTQLCKKYLLIIQTNSLNKNYNVKANKKLFQPLNVSELCVLFYFCFDVYYRREEKRLTTAPIR